jgi:hypothetical protein
MVPLLSNVTDLKQNPVSGGYEGKSKGISLQRSRMAADSVGKIVKALNTLDSAIDKAAKAAGPLARKDPALVARMNSYKEVVRRQRILVRELEMATLLRDWKGVTRMSELVRRSSIMIKDDADYILRSLRDMQMAYEA